MLQIYLDDSGTHTDSRVVVVGGLIGSIDNWTDFTARWRNKLDRPLPNKAGLRKFSLADCIAHRNEFEGYSAAESDLLTHEMRQIVKNSGCIGYAAGIDKVAWDELVTEGYRQGMGPAEHFCLTKCVREMLSEVREQFSGHDKVAIIYDMGRKPLLLERIERFDWARGLDCPSVVTFTYGEVAEHLPLQGADMIATESYWFFLSRNQDRGAEARPHFQDYIKAAEGRGLFMSRDIIVRELAARNPNGTVRR